jgi:hypothetical protein
MHNVPFGNVQKYEQTYLETMTIKMQFVFILKKNKKLLAELISHFLLIRHGEHRERLQKFLAAAGTCLLSRYLATMAGYTDRPTDSPLI